MERLVLHLPYNPLCSSSRNGCCTNGRRRGGAPSVRPLPSPSLSLPICTNNSAVGKHLSSLNSALPLFGFHFPSPPLPRFPSRVARVSSSAYNTDVDDPSELNKRTQVSKRIERTANYFKRLGGFGFWSQLACTVVSGVILAFSVAISGKPVMQATFYLTAGGIAAAFLSVFWSFGYLRLSNRLRSTFGDLSKVPPRAEVVQNLKNGIIINLVGMASTILGMQATVGLLVAKALTSPATPYAQGSFTGASPVLALDVFLVQASANAILSHFLGLVFSLELLRSVTLAQPPPDNVIPKPA